MIELSVVVDNVMSPLPMETLIAACSEKNVNDWFESLIGYQIKRRLPYKSTVDDNVTVSNLALRIPIAESRVIVQIELSPI
jgi:hypothetical protein